MSKVVVSSHPIVLHKLAELRNLRTGPAEFRRLVKALASCSRRKRRPTFPQSRLT